jgi:anti-sigma B factor antagonist
MMSQVHIQKQQVGDICILGWENSHLDSSNTNDFKTQAGSCIGTSKKVILDLTGVTFIDSTGLGALLSILRTMRERNGDFRVCCPAKAILLLFELVRIDKILDIHKTRKEAIIASTKL